MKQEFFLLAVVFLGAASYLASRVARAVATESGSYVADPTAVSRIAMIVALGLLAWSAGAFGWQWVAIGMIALLAVGNALGVVLGGKAAYAQLLANVLCVLGVASGFVAIAVAA
jgi:hypothetical protein